MHNIAFLSEAPRRYRFIKDEFKVNRIGIQIVNIQAMRWKIVDSAASEKKNCECMLRSGESGARVPLLNGGRHSNVLSRIWDWISLWTLDKMLATLSLHDIWLTLCSKTKSNTVFFSDMENFLPWDEMCSLNCNSSLTIYWLSRRFFGTKHRRRLARNIENFKNSFMFRAEKAARPGSIYFRCILFS